MAKNMSRDDYYEISRTPNEPFKYTVTVFAAGVSAHDERVSTKFGAKYAAKRLREQCYAASPTITDTERHYFS